MVLWSLVSVILFLCSSACTKLDNDYRRISPYTVGLMEKDLAPFGEAGGNRGLSCRYSKLLSTLKEKFDLDSKTAGFNNAKTKKKYKAKRLGSDSVEEDVQSDTIQLEVDENGGSNLNAVDDFDFLKEDEVKRGTNSPTVGCDCKIKNDLLDLGHLHYPRYLLNAVCQKEDETFEYPPKCWRGAQCKPLEYKVRVLTYRSHNDHLQKDPTMSLLPDVLRSFWKFKTVTVAAGCFCS